MKQYLSLWDIMFCAVIDDNLFLVWRDHPPKCGRIDENHEVYIQVMKYSETCTKEVFETELNNTKDSLTIALYKTMTNA